MTEIQGKSILVRVSEGSSYRESTVLIIGFRSVITNFYIFLSKKCDRYFKVRRLLQGATEHIAPKAKSESNN